MTGPVATVTGLQGGGTSSGSATPTIVGTITNPYGSVSGVTVEVYVDDVLDGTCITDAVGNWNYSTTALTNGSHSITAKALTRARGTQAVKSVKLIPPMTFVSTRLRYPVDFENLSGTYKAVACRLSAGSPGYDILAGRAMRVFFPGCYCDGLGASPTELEAAGPWQVAYSLEYDGVRYPATFSGATWSRELGGDGASQGYDTDFDWGIWSDEFTLPVTVPANSNWFHVSEIQVADSATKFPTHMAVSPWIGDAGFAATTAAEIEPYLTSGTITTNSSGLGHLVAPTFMVAECGDGRDVVLVIGDSRADGNGDFRTGQRDPRGIRGSVERGLDGLTGGRIASNSLATSGSGTGGTVAAPGMDHRAAPLQWIKDTYGSFPFTCILDEHGHNGTQNWTTMTNHVNAVKGYFPGIRYIKTTMPPSIGQDTTDAFRTLDGVTPIASRTWPSGSYALLNDDIVANRDGLFDVVIDTGKYGRANLGVSDGLPGHTDDFMKSRHPTAPRSGTLSRDWDGTSTGGLYLDFEPHYGDTLNWDAAARGNTAYVVTVTDVGGGEWMATLEVSTGLGTPLTAGTSVIVIPTLDGTHQGPWLYMLEGTGYEIPKAQGVFGT